ncbi:hypothetical protein C8A01DRAFT_50921 [Parachaetomium inaequale]|uniref:Uncharacterized protein n=1 Tax=Parachaetomium inaequale TaxID=2588326 RepID=A0AAN6P5V0_9PEZI|nr:hypothetical protein C8A01DRAFT_50921 [Parachaetomium inaequale]
MHTSRLLSLFTLLAASIANAALLDSNPDYSLILSRQAPGTPQYECHSNCGNALAGGRNPAHCENATWTGYYEACLDCALDFDIWRIYGNGVSSAASACGLSATPSPSGDSESALSSTAGLRSEGSADPTITTPPSTESETAGSIPSSTSSVSTAGAPRSGVYGSLVGVWLLVTVFVGLMGPW